MTFPFPIFPPLAVACTCTPAYVTGDRTGSITVSTDLTLGGGVISNWVNGSTAGFDTGSSWYSTSAVAGKFVRLDYVSPTKLTEAKFYHQGTPGDSQWKWQRLSSGVWVDVGAAFAFGAGTFTDTSLSANASGAASWRLLGVSGSFNGQWMYELEMKQCAC